MVADLRKMQENQWLSEIRIDKYQFINNFTSNKITQSLEIQSFIFIDLYHFHKSLPPK